jgi:hypothetical protein
MANSLLYKASVRFCPLSEADRVCAAAGQSLAAAQKLHDNDAPQVKVGTARSVAGGSIATRTSSRRRNKKVIRLSPHHRFVIAWQFGLHGPCSVRGVHPLINLQWHPRPHKSNLSRMRFKSNPKLNRGSNRISLSPSIVARPCMSRTLSLMTLETVFS